MSKPQVSPEQTFYNCIEKNAVAEFKDRGSKFLAYAYPVESPEEFKKYLLALKKEHPKAVHHCFAYRIGTDGNVFRVSDDGEPSGSAGRPMLGQIDSKQITNVAVIVVRYFGGTLLGVPGLINAYKTAAALALQVVPVVQKQITVNYKIQFDYTQVNEVLQLLKQQGCVIISQDLQLFCLITVAIPKNKIDEVMYRLKDIGNLGISKE